MPTVKVEGLGNVQFPDGMPEEEMTRHIQQALAEKSTPAPTSGPIAGSGVPAPPEPTVGQNAAYEAVEGAKGFGKGVVGTAQGLGDLISPKGSFFDTGHVMNTDAINPDQMAGKALESAAEFALPVLKGAEAIPSASRAAGALGDVAEAAKNVRVPLSKAVEPLGRVTELGERGGTLPTSANSLLKRSQMVGDMSFPEARDYYSNISSLSGDEANKLNPIMKKAVGELRKGFHGDLTDAASSVGMGDQYANAMKEYAQAMKLRGFVKDAVTKYLPVGGGVLGALDYAAHKFGGK
jgi:hypothetical protein